MASVVPRLSFCAVALLGIFLVCFKEADSKWVEGTIDKQSTWEFLTRFCFLSKRSSNEEGGMRYEFRYPVEYGVQNLLFYYDTPGQWDSVYKRGKTCQQMNDALKGKNSFSLYPTLCSEVTVDNAPWYSCVGKMDFSSARERWWYTVVSRCGTPNNVARNGSMYLYYKLHLTNGDDFMHEEYSADEFYIVITDIVFFILYIIMMVILIVCSVILKKRQLLHTTYKMFVTAVAFWTFHLVCMVYAWTSYGVTGWEKPGVEVFGRMLQAVSNIIFMLLLILMAKGYTIVRGKLTNKAVIKITVFILLYSVITATMFIWERLFFDPGLVLYYYESPPGYGLIVITLIGWLWLTKAIVFTLKHYKAKTYFYIIFYSVYTLWFWAGPVVVLLAMFAMAKWTREKTVNGVQQFVGFVGHVIFLFLTLPHKVNSNFPFHIKTTQIGAASADDQEEMRDVGPYSVSQDVHWSGTGPNLEFFITSKGGTGDGGQMFGPLESSVLDPGSSRSGDSPPPSYPQAMRSLNLGPINTQFPNDKHLQHNMESSDSPPQYTNAAAMSLPTGNQLPPLKRAMMDERPESERSTLPPIRGTMLPSLLPSAPPTEDTDYSGMFLVDKK